MNSVFYFSCGGHSRAVADFLARELGTEALSFGSAPPSVPRPQGGAQEVPCAGCAVVVFPVYCQSLPAPVRAFLCALRSPAAALVAVYGGVSHGRALFEAQRLYRGRVVAGAYVPTGHTFLGEGDGFDAEALRPLVSRLREAAAGAPAAAVRIPRSRKNPFAGFAPAWRSRVGVRLLRSDSCDGCDLCGRICPVGAMRRGEAGRKCIRCLRCLHICPKGALSFSLRPVLRRYLARFKKRRAAEVFL